MDMEDKLLLANGLKLNIFCFLHNVLLFNLFNISVLSVITTFLASQFISPIDAKLQSAIILMYHI